MGEARGIPPGLLRGRGEEVRWDSKRGFRILFIGLLAVTSLACNQTSGTVRGFVTSVEGSLDEVTGFTVLVEGSELGFVPVQDGDYDFPLPHLREHVRTGEPVLVGWELVGTVRYALSLADG